MSQRFFRCRLCGTPHEIDTSVCPIFRLPIPASQVAIAPPEPDPQSLDDHPTSEHKLVVRVPSLRGRPGTMPPPLPSEPKSEPLPWMAPSVNVEPPRQETGAIPLLPKRVETAKGDEIVGQVIDDRYRIVSVIATGGMGIVYEAVHVDLGRRVALKALARRFSEDAVAVARFRNEARIAGGLGHPNIVEVFDMGTMPDRSPYLVMERLEGETLGQRLKRDRTLPIDEVIHVTSQILSGLSATHQRNIVHRDLKPENVFLSPRTGFRPQVKLLDFGVSKNFHLVEDDHSLSLTRAGFVMGTPTYMAPEQARGERNLDGRTDIYAVGVLAYEMLLGRPPYVAKHPAGLMAEMRKNPAPPPRKLRPEVSADFEDVLRKFLMLDRRHRYETAAEALHALGKLPKPIDPQVEDPTQRIARPPKSEPDNVEIFSLRGKPKG